MTIADSIRDACAAVAREAQFVSIEESRIAKCAASLPFDQLRAPAVDPERHYLGHGDDTAAFFVTLDAINFGSGYFPHLRKRAGCSGYFTIASCLTDQFRTHGPWTAAQLAELSSDECARIFEQSDPDDAIRELMALFASALNVLGKFLIDNLDGSFVNLIRSADQSVERLVEILARMPFFNDVQRYRDREVPFFKRAQLTTADLAIAFNHEGLGKFIELGSTDDLCGQPGPSCAAHRRDLEV